MPSRAAAQTPLHKMYTFVYRTFIKFILFCRGQAPDVSGFISGANFLPGTGTFFLEISSNSIDLQERV